MEGDNTKSKRQRCEVYSRVVGYLRPVDQFNPGKQSEYYDRKTYRVNNGLA
jgi:ribonucleoside-triphosphate reductase (formate)